MCMYMCVEICMCCGVSTDIRGQLTEVGIHLPPWEGDLRNQNQVVRVGVRCLYLTGAILWP